MNVPGWVHVLPHVNATLNGASCVMLVAGLTLLVRFYQVRGLPALFWGNIC